MSCELADENHNSKITAALSLEFVMQVKVDVVSVM